jgi:hypothetical protein
MADLSETTTGLARELLALERQYWKAIQERDAETAMRLSDETCLLAGAQGVRKLDRQTLGRMTAQMGLTIDSVRLGDDAQVLQLTDDVAVLAYQVHEELTVDGKTVVLDAADASTWVKRDGAWRCALHTESLAGDPFGRDRTRREPTLVKGLE